MKTQQDKKLFKLVDKRTKEKWKKFAKYYLNDSKPFINKISRDYESTGKFPYHVLKMIKKIPKEKYHSAICVLRGAIPYSILFELQGWKIHYIICGRINETPMNLRINKSVDKTLSQIKENFSFVDNVQISKSMQGKGLGTFLMDLMEKETRKKGLKKIRLKVFKDNLARKLYLKLGYKQIKAEGSAVILEKKLK